MIQKHIVASILGGLVLTGASFYAGRVTAPTHRVYHNAAVRVPSVSHRQDEDTSGSQPLGGADEPLVFPQPEGYTGPPLPTPTSSSDVLVWANPHTRVYHLPTSRWYGLTKGGAYMSEHDAIATGYRVSGRG